MKAVYNFVAIAALFPLGLFLYQDNLIGVTASLAVCFLFLVFANLEKFSSFAVKWLGIEARLREAVTEAQATLAQLKQVVKPIVKAALTAIIGSSRLDGINPAMQAAIREDFERVMSALEFKKDDLADVFEFWNAYEGFDLRLAIMEGTNSQSLTENQKQRHAAATSFAIGPQPRPEEIESLLVELDKFTEQKRTLLERYRVFLTQTR